MKISWYWDSPRLNSHLCMAQEISWYWNSLHFWTVVFVWLRRSADIGTLLASEQSSLYGSEDQLILGLSLRLNSPLCMAQISWYWDSLRFWTVVFVWLRRSADFGTVAASEQSSLLWLRRWADIGTLSDSELSSLYGSDQLILGLSVYKQSSFYGSGDQLTLGLFCFWAVVAQR